MANYYQVNIPSQKPVFTNSKKIKKQLEENSKKVMEEIGIRVSWDTKRETNKA